MWIKKLLVVLVFCFSSTLLSQVTDFFDKTDTFMQTYVKDGLVLYDAIKQNPSALDALVEELETISVSKKNTNTYVSFWINAYNITVIKQVMAHYPLKSVLDVPGFFDTNTHTIANQEVTLNAIENTMLRAEFLDAKIHFALVCAGLGCPVLLDKAYRPEVLEKQLIMQTKKALDDPLFIQVKSKGKKTAISELFKWYTTDFTHNHPDLITFINTYKTQPLKTNTKISYYPYNWQLNQATIK